MTRKAKQSGRCAAPPKRDLNNLASNVRAYRKYNRPHALDELDYFRGMQSLSGAIESAGFATDWRGRRFDHQRRLSASALRAGTNALKRRMNQIEATRSFHELLELLQSICSNIAGLGELYAYDTALRISVFLGFEPRHVYLHAGTRKGVRALGISTAKPFVTLSELPKPLRTMPAHELEDLLCIYKERLREIFR